MAYSEAELNRMLKENPDLIIVTGGSYTTLEPRVKTKLPKLTEREMQAAVIVECDRRARTRPIWGTLFAIPNGQYRKGQRMEPGLRPGVPDLFFPVAMHGYHGLFIELKVGDYKPTAVQQAWMRALQDAGYYCKVIWDNPDNVILLIEWYLEATV